MLHTQSLSRFSQTGAPFIIIAAILWSFDGILRRNLYSLPPATIVFFEHVLGAFILLPLFVRRSKELNQLGKKEWFAILLVSLFSGALGTIFYTAALGMVQYIQFSVVVLLQQLQPIWAITAAAIILNEKITKDFIKWAVIAIGGAYLITFKDLTINLSTGTGTIIAAALAISAGFVWGVSTSFSKIVLNKVSYITATSLRFFLAPLFAFVFIVSLNQQNSLTLISQEQWKYLLAITFSTGMVALGIYYFGLKKTPARVSSICELTWPASAIFIDYFLYQQMLTWTQVIGVLLLLFSMYHVSQYKK